MAAKFFTGLPLDGPDPECVQGHGEAALAAVDRRGVPRPAEDHSHAGGVRGGPVPVTIGRRPAAGEACDESPLARGVADRVTRWLENAMVRDGRRGAAAGEEAAAESVYMALLAGSEAG